MARKRGRKGSSKPHHRSQRRVNIAKSDPLTGRAVDEILSLLKERPKRTYRVQDIVRELAESTRHERALRDAVAELLEQGRLRRVKGKKVQYSPGDDLVSGELQLAEKGFGFVRQGEDKDIYIPHSKLRGATHGDRVEAAVTGSGRFGNPQGRVVRVLERDDTPIIGRFVETPGRGGLVYPDNPKVQGPIEVPEHQMRGAEDGDRVQVVLDHERRVPHGRVVMVFGRADDPRARYKALIAQHKFRENFSEEALEEAEQAVEEVPEEELRRREDLRDRHVITIDPASAHDFDDALSLRELEGGEVELGVHIADVSWYVAEGSALDREARERGTSVYTSHGTLPMLPERLSSDLCSLREGVERRSMSVFLRMKRDGEVLSARPARSLIRSSRRMTYHEAQQAIERARNRWGDDLPELEEGSMDLFLHHLAHLARAMRKRRFAEGGLDLEVPEYEVVIGENDRPERIVKRQVMEANHLVEECMLAANRAVTEWAHRERGGGPRAFVYRVHASPDPEKLEELAAFVQALDLTWPFGVNLEQIPARRINEWLASIEDHPLAEVVRIHTLRAMAKAEYSTENYGHYGLGFANYTHFTSPIRRYPDLLVHRILNSHLEGTKKYGPDVQQDLQRDCELASERERAAQEMERQSLRIRQAEYFAERIGQVFEGMIVGAINKGVFVEIQEMGVQGMILADDLGPVYYDREQHAHVRVDGEGLYGPGKRMKVKVLEADPDLGRIELGPA